MGIRRIRNRIQHSHDSSRMDGGSNWPTPFSLHDRLWMGTADGLHRFCYRLRLADRSPAPVRSRRSRSISRSDKGSLHMDGALGAGFGIGVAQRRLPSGRGNGTWHCIIHYPVARMACLLSASRCGGAGLGCRVVLGYKADEIASKIAHTSCKIVKNDQYQQGMFTSMQAGLRELPKKTKIVMLAICDQPRLKRETVETLIGEFEKERHKILIPSYNGRQGHPPLLRAEYAKDILAMDESMTLKHFYGEHADDIARLVVEDEGVLIDIDDRETYERELKKQR